MKDVRWLNPSQWCILLDAAHVGVLAGEAFVFSLDDGTANGIGIYKTSGSGALNAYVNNPVPLGVTVADGERFRAAITWSDGGASASAAINGRQPVPVKTTKRVWPTALSIGSARDNLFVSTLWARALQYWPQRMSDKDLSHLTRLT